MQKNKQRPGVMMYFHLLRPMRCLPKEQFADLVWALLDYAEFGVLPTFEDLLLQMSWAYLQHAADVDLERYEERVAQNKAASAKRWGKDASASTCMQMVPNNSSNPEPDTMTKRKTKADADAIKQASASANTKTKNDGKEPFAIPFVPGEDFTEWRERQMEAITEYNRNLRAEAMAKKQTAG